MYLLDTAIVLDLSRLRGGHAEPALADWVADTARERLFLSAISLIELQNAASRTARRDRAAGAALGSWIGDRLVPSFEGHVLPVDTAVARRRADLTLADARDALFAATALVHGLTLVTRDTRAFKGTRVRLFDPSTYQRPAAADDWRTAGQARPLWLRNMFIRG